MNAIIIYYSRSGNTEKYATQLHSDLGYELLKIEPEEQYGNYIMSCFRVMKENATKTIIPFATYGMSGINWTMKTLKKLFPDSEIKLPFDNGLLKKGDYQSWLSKIKTLR